MSEEYRVLKSAKIRKDLQSNETITAHIIDDTRIGEAAWSSKNLVDKLCPTFTESGSVVACEPVEGYPLKVVSFVNPNLITENITGISGMRNGWAFDEDYWQSPVCILPSVPAGTYTFYCEIVVADSDDPASLYVQHSGGVDDVPHQTPLTFVHAGGDIVLVDSWFPTNLQSVKLEVGTEYTGANYATTITRYGKNLMTYDTVDTTSTASNKKLWSGSLKPPYVISGDFSQYTEGNKAGLIQCTFADGTTVPVAPSMLSAGYTNTKTLTQIKYVHWDTGFGIAKLQLEVGSVATAFEPYINKTTFALGEFVPAIAGVNTLMADNGDITVIGKADPIAIIDKLTNAIVALGGNV